jgi:hypothetical protein
MTLLTGDPPENHLLHAAFAYARRGWQVMPLHEIVGGQCSCGKGSCRTPGKHPRTRHGLKDATLDEAVIQGWWAKWPSANVGIRTGPESGFFMIGPDGQAGIEALADLERRHGPLPPTPRLRSGGGGQHYYFAWPPDGTIKTGANRNGLPIDVRGAGGLVVAPRSAHVSGGHYTWELPPEDAALAPAPPWLLDWLRGDKNSQTTEGVGPEVNGKVLFTVQPAVGADVPSRVIAYLEKCPPAVSGQGGHSQTFEVARAVVYGFDLGPEVGCDLLRSTPTCSRS